jgi:hypothetical protein
MMRFSDFVDFLGLSEIEQLERRFS